MIKHEYVLFFARPEAPDCFLPAGQFKGPSGARWAFESFKSPGELILARLDIDGGEVVGSHFLDVKEIAPADGAKTQKG